MERLRCRRIREAQVPLSVGEWDLGQGVRKVTNRLRSGLLRGRKMGERVPIFPKNECYQYPVHLQKRQISGGFQGA